MVEMLMWPTNTAAVGAFEFRSEDSSSLGTTSSHFLPAEEEYRSSNMLMLSQMF